MKKVFSLLLALIMVTGIISAIVISAGAAEVSVQNGIEAEIKTDKDTYSATDEINISLNVKNTNTFDLKGINTAIELPTGLELKSGELSTVNVNVEAGGTYSNSVTSVKTGSNDANPKTGVDSNPLFWIMLFISSASGIVLSFMYRKRAKNILSIMLCLLMIGAMLPTGALAADNQTMGAITIDKNIIVGGDDYNIKGTVNLSDGLSLNVNTALPTGRVDNNEVAVEYSATTVAGASITEVYYTINGGAPEYVYINGVYGAANKGTLGTATVLLVSGENNIVFTAKDSRGKETSFVVANKPEYILEETSEIDPEHLNASQDGDYLFVDNRIMAYAMDEASATDVQQAINAIGGKIISHVTVVDLYEIEVAPGTEAELNAMIVSLMETGFFEYATTSRVYNTGTDANPTADPWWGKNEWGLSAINLPEAWEAYEGLFRQIKVGVCDNGFDTNHEDLKLESKNITNREIATKDHGSHVLGTVASIHDNNKGLCGVLDLKRKNIYANDIFDIDASVIAKWYEFWKEDIISDRTSQNAQLAGLRYSVINGAKVINYSIGGGGADVNSAATYAIEMRKLIRKGYDFLVVTSAGNDETADAAANNSFCAITDMSGVVVYGGRVLGDATDVSKNVIVVGASNDSNEVCDFSSFGSRVDVVAPGKDIYSTVNGGYDGTYDGTSMASPHVTGLSALVWSTNPGLTAAQVKDIIVTTADTTIYDREGGNVDGDYINKAENIRIAYKLINAKAAVDKAVSMSSDNTGNVVGKVVVADDDSDPTNNATISGAVVSLHQSFAPGLNGELEDPFFKTTSDGDGNYRIDSLPTGEYYYQISADGFIPIQGHIQVTAGVTTYINALEAINATGDGKISGNIVNAFDGTLVTDTEITLKFQRGIDIPGASVVETLKTSTGSYSVTLPAGNYTVTATGDDYIATVSYVVSIGNKTKGNQNIIISPKLSTDNIRVVLSWGEIPSDLDSHMTGPSTSSADGKFHTYYSRQGYLMESNYYTNDIDDSYDYNVALDIDDVSSYGPETTTIYSPVNGTYNFYVHNYSDKNSTTSASLRNSQATVRIYDATNRLIAQYSVPTDGEYSTIWHVFSISYNDGTWSAPVAVNSMINTPTNPSDIG